MFEGMSPEEIELMHAILVEHLELDKDIYVPHYQLIESWIEQLSTKMKNAPY